MNVDIHTSDPDHVDPVQVKDALEAANFLVVSVSVNDGERVWDLDSESVTKPVPDLQMDVTGTYEGDAYPAPAEYRIHLTVLDTGNFWLVVENTSGAAVNSHTLDAATAEAVKDMAGTNHGLSAYEDDWSLPVGMDRALSWNVGSGNDVVVLDQGRIDEIAQWLRYATGEDEYDGSPDEWEY